MYQLIMTVILIATFAAVTVMGINTMQPSAMIRITDVEVVISEHLRFSLAIQAYRRANGELPASDGWIGSINPYLNADPRVMPEGISLAYIRMGDEFMLCARGANAWSSDGLKEVSCMETPDRWKKVPDMLVATPDRTYLAPGELPLGGLFVEVSPYRVLLRNEGSASVNITAASFDQGTRFRIESTDCIGALAPAATCSVDYVFASDPSGAGEDTMTIFSDRI